MKEDAEKSGKLSAEVFGLIYIFWALFLLLSLLTYTPTDPSFNQVVSRQLEIGNGAGLVGAYLGGLLVDLFGIDAFVFPLIFLVAGLRRFAGNWRIPWWRWVGLGLLSLCLGVVLSATWPLEHVAVGSVTGGGLLGSGLHRVSQYYLQPSGAFLFWTFLFLVSLQLVFGMSWPAVLLRLRSWLLSFWQRYGPRILALVRRKTPSQTAALELIVPPGASVAPESGTLSIFRAGDDDETGREPDGQADDTAKTETASAPPSKSGPPTNDDSGLRVLSPPSPTRPADKKPIKKIVDRLAGLVPLPGLDLLSPVVRVETPQSADLLRDKAERLTSCLADFGVQGAVQTVSPGPVVTRFEFKPAPGIKVSRIASLSDDLSLALKALAVRIEAPIPGKDTVGVEVPSEQRETVFLREIIDSSLFANSKSLLTLALGKDISGRPFVADLARMPHLLVAGATGAGKSVCLNSVLLSFMYKARPEDVKLLLIDPKRIELAIYAELPHLVHPVVTEMTEAKGALDWAVHEMDNRYEAMARLGVRNIVGYNEKLHQLRASKDEESLAEIAELEPMPYLVIIIDELADLMLTAAKEVEVNIVRLAQLARAAGIHMILATQRPSVDVVTGLIKANFPCRISFQVTSKHDSRTILDQVGAEHLLGKGDMLFKPSGGKLQRLHGAFVSDEEVVAVVGYWKKKQKPNYTLDFAEWQADGDAGQVLDGGGGAGALDGDSIYREAVEFVCSQGRASISLLQRRFRIGYNRSARYIEQMETDGILGPADGIKPRAVLRGRE